MIVEYEVEVLEMLDNQFLQDQIGILGMLLQGPDNARDGLVIWPCNNIAVDEISIYAAGFSGETRAVEVKTPGGQKSYEIVSVRFV